jgi:hypothetical protein
MATPGLLLRASTDGLVVLVAGGTALDVQGRNVAM